MADISTRMSVSGLSQWRSSYQQAMNSVKTLDAELKKNEAQYKASGDKAQYMAEKERILQQQLKQQKQAASEAEKALKAMKDQGVDPASKSYQEFQRKLAEAQTAVLNTTVAMNNLDQSEKQAADGADKLTGSLGSISKKVNLDAVISGVGSITKGLEDAAKAALRFAREAWSEVMDVASWADDTLTMSTMLGIDQDEMQRMLLVAPQFEISGESLGKTWHRVRLSMTSDSEEVLKAFDRLGVKTHDVFHGAHGDVVGQARDWKDVFWETGEAIMKVTDEAEQDRLATTLLGKSWEEMKPLFSQGREAFEEAMDSQTTASEDAMVNLATLNDTVEELKGKFRTLETEVLGELAPHLTKIAEVAGQLLDRITAFLQTEKGQELLERMGEALDTLFEDLASIDPEEVVENLVSVFSKVKEGLEWLIDNKGDVVGALKWIIGGWAGLKLTGGALKVYQLITGVLGLANTGEIAAAGTAAGSAWGGAFAKAVLAAAPWLIGVIELLNPAASASNDLDVMYDEKTGQLTTAGWDDFYRNPENWRETLDVVGDLFGDLARIVNNPDAMNAIGRYAFAGEDKDRLIADLEALGYTRVQPAPVQAVPDIATVDANGNMYDSSGNKVGFQIPRVEVPADIKPEVPEDAPETITDQIGVVPVEVRPYVANGYSAAPGDEHGGIGGGGPGSSTYYSMHANGLPWVPRDGYIAMLHRGERVMTATENRNYTYNSNNYFGNVNLNNGMEIDALCDSIDRHNRRQHAGYGS